MNFVDFLHGVFPIPPELITHLPNTVETVTLKKNDYLLKAGAICDRVCFIKEGLLRSFAIKKGREVAYWFMKENEVAVALQSFINQEPSKESIQALEDCTLQCINYSHLQDAYNRYAGFNAHRETFAGKYIILNDERHDILQEDDPLERYRILLENQPEWIRRVQDKHIASYLEVRLSIVTQLKRMSKQTLPGRIKLSL